MSHTLDLQIVISDDDLPPEIGCPDCGVGLFKECYTTVVIDQTYGVRLKLHNCDCCGIFYAFNDSARTLSGVVRKDRSHYGIMGTKFSGCLN